MTYLPAAFSLLVAIAGWFYMFYSKSAGRLSVVEAAPRNRLRIRLRRIGGFVMVVLAFCFYGVFVSLEKRNGPAAGGYLMGVLLLLIVILCLGLADVRLTRRLREDRKRQS